MKTYKDLTVWQKSMDLVWEIYRITKKFPGEEVYGLTSQMRRAAVSIPSNIAEGSSHRSRKDYTKFVRIAFGSAAELETQILIAKKLELADEKDFNKAEGLLEEVLKMLNALGKSLSTKS